VLLFARGSQQEVLDLTDIREGLYIALDRLGKRKKVLAIPPDITRIHSQGGIITQYLYDYYRQRLTDILPALGTHSSMTEEEISNMFGQIPKNLFRVHFWKKDLATLGEVPQDYLRKISEGKVNFNWPVQINKLLINGNFDLIVSIGQVVPHEVIGMANYNKNILVGVGGRESVHKSHFLGAAYGMERIMGKINNPVRQLLNYASQHYLRHLPIIYILTVVSRDESGKLVIRGLFIGDDEQCFVQAAQLSLQVNFEFLESPLKKVIVYLDPIEYKSTWLGNKSIYRTRMAIADGGDLVVLAPGVFTFGEDREIDQLIRKFGYRTTPEILENVNKHEELQNNLAAAAHLIHGSSENRFKITYCPGHLSKEEIEGVNFKYKDLSEMLKRYQPERLTEGFNTLIDGEEIFYISNPALGLWTCDEKFKE
jgi:nickel-dependent lactate racemase